MAKKLISTSSPLPICFFFILVLSQLCNSTSSKGRGKISGMFVFGSSLVDNGNINFLGNGNAGVNYLPYGIDFPQGPTGRFTNGMNVIDALGQLLKLPLIPPSQQPNTNGRNILHGVDFAFGASGILDDTSPPLAGLVGVNGQIKNFEKVTLPDLSAQLRFNDTNSVVSALFDYLFVIGAGGNDLRKYYFLPSNISKPSPQDFVRNLTDTLSGQIKRLYSLGARKFVLIAVYPLGCIPSIKKSLPDPKGCLEDLDHVGVLFNSNMKSLVDSLKPQMPGSNLVYVDSYKIIKDVLMDPVSKGFNDTNNACCEVPSSGEPGGGVICKKGGFVCKDRRGYVFFDGLHTSEAMNIVIAKKGYSSMLPSEAYPFNVRKLVTM